MVSTNHIYLLNKSLAMIPKFYCFFMHKDSDNMCQNTTQVRNRHVISMSHCHQSFPLPALVSLQPASGNASFAGITCLKMILLRIHNTHIRQFYSRCPGDPDISASFITSFVLILLQNYIAYVPKRDTGENISDAIWRFAGIPYICRC